MIFILAHSPGGAATPGVNLIQLLQSVGPSIAYIIVFAFVFIEDGFLVGLFLPGDSLLLTAGLIAAKGWLNPFAIVLLAFVGAVLGDSVGYWLGRKAGPPIFSRPDSRFFRREHLLRAKAFYDRRGAITIAAARFIPYLRTFAPLVAGAVAMEYRLFAAFNILGGALWSITVTLAGFLIGYFFGQIPGIDRYYTLVLLTVMVLSAIPVILQLWKGNRRTFAAWFDWRMKRHPVSKSH